jgi:hypothetical protein
LTNFIKNIYNFSDDVKKKLCGVYEKQVAMGGGILYLNMEILRKIFKKGGSFP